MFNHCLKSVVLIACQLSFIAVAHAGTESDAGKDTFVENAFYTITTEVGGKPMALTFIVPPNARPETLTTNAADAKVVLEAVKANEKSQQWQFDHRPVAPGNMFNIFSKVSDSETRLTGVLQVFDCNGDFAGMNDDKFHDKYNRLTVGINSGEQKEYWQVLKQSNGKFKIVSSYGMKDHLKGKGDSPNYGWKEERALEAVKAAGGKFKVRQGKLSNAPGQLWTITPVGK